ncbi:rho/rac/cdc gtpase-activating protein [Anaeramoeba flamelloides]|uniref:Rho/rac/cdc gtpase-activating protein n=1 Tax=Anaeramoeba flamelloides TaxID=1746091 RepID=A0ABQ8XSD0_9EUKA|nr:rho/rac/cdc gtpase-activating protein [Anaeramoeba flamelloides]
MSKATNYNPIGLADYKGLVFYRNNAVKKWKKKFCQLKGGYIFFFKNKNDRKPEFEVSLKNAQADEFPNGQLKRDFIVLVDLTNQVGENSKISMWYLSLENEEEKLSCLKSVKLNVEKMKGTSPLFGGSLENAICKRKDGVQIPSIVENAVKYLENPRRKALQLEGLFRVSGESNEIKRIKSLYNKDEIVDLETVQNPHVVTGLLKLFFRELNEPLLTFRLYDELKRLIANFRKNENNIEKFGGILKTLPKGNYITYKYLIKFLKNVSQYEKDNRMSAQNLAVVFGPNLIYRQNSSPLESAGDSTFQEAICTTCINEFDSIFKDDPYEEKTKKKIYVQAISGYTAKGEGQLSFKKGAIIKVLKKDPRGWWYGTINKQKPGIFPSNYTKEVTGEELTQLNLPKKNIRRLSGSRNLSFDNQIKEKVQTKNRNYSVDNQISRQILQRKLSNEKKKSPIQSPRKTSLNSTINRINNQEPDLLSLFEQLKSKNGSERTKHLESIVYNLISEVNSLKNELEEIKQKK